MPASCSEVVTFPAAVLGPASGDPRTAASVRSLGDALNQRCRWLLARHAELGGTYLPVGSTPTPLTSCNVTSGAFTLSGHGLSANYPVRLTIGAAGGTVPTNTPVDTIFYAIVIDANTFGLSLTSGGAQLTTLGGALSGEVYAVYCTDSAGRIFMPAAGPLPAGTLRSILGALPYGGLGTTNTWTGANSFQNVQVSSIGGQYNLPLVPGANIGRELELRIVNKGAYSDTATSSSAFWTLQNGVANTGTIPAVRSKTNLGSGDYFWLALDFPNGATSLEVIVWTIGGVNNNPTGAVASYQIVKYRFNSAETAVSTAVLDAHTTGGGGNILTTVVGTPIPATSALTVADGTYRYALKVNCPWDGVSQPYIEVRGITVTFYANDIAATR